MLSDMKNSSLVSVVMRLLVSIVLSYIMYAIMRNTTSPILPLQSAMIGLLTFIITFALPFLFNLAWSFNGRSVVLCFCFFFIFNMLLYVVMKMTIADPDQPERIKYIFLSPILIVGIHNILVVIWSITGVRYAHYMCMMHIRDKYGDRMHHLPFGDFINGQWRYFLVSHESDADGVYRYAHAVEDLLKRKGFNPTQSEGENEEQLIVVDRGPGKKPATLTFCENTPGIIRVDFT